MIFGNRPPCGRQWPLLFPALAVPCRVWAAMTLPKARDHTGPATLTLAAPSTLCLQVGMQLKLD